MSGAGGGGDTTLEGYMLQWLSLKEIKYIFCWSLLNTLSRITYFSPER